MAAHSTHDSCNMQQHDISPQHDISAALSKKPDRTFSPERIPAPETGLPWDVLTRNQALSTPTDIYRQNDIRGFVFGVEISDKVALECVWNLGATHKKIPGTFLLRAYKLSLAKDIEGLNNYEDVSYLNLEQCPHSFPSSMIRHCEVYVTNRGWTLISDLAEIDLLLKHAARIWHDLEPEIPTSVCEIRRRAFETEGEGLLQSGSLNVLQKALVKTDNPPSDANVEKWLDRLTHHKKLDRMSQWESAFTWGSYLNLDVEPEVKMCDCGHSIELSLLQENLEAAPQQRQQQQELETTPPPMNLEIGFRAKEWLADPIVLLIRGDPDNEAKLEVKKVHLSTMSKLQALPVEVSARVRFLPQMMFATRSGQYLDKKFAAIKARIDLKRWTHSQVPHNILIFFLRDATTHMLDIFDRLVTLDLTECKDKFDTELEKNPQLWYTDIFRVPRPPMNLKFLEKVETTHSRREGARPEPTVIATSPPRKCYRKVRFDVSPFLESTVTPVTPPEDPDAPACEGWFRITKQKKGGRVGKKFLTFIEPRWVLEN